MASGTSEHTRAVIDHGAVPKFVQLLGSASDDVREQVFSLHLVIMHLNIFFTLFMNCKCDLQSYCLLFKGET